MIDIIETADVMFDISTVCLQQISFFFLSYLNFTKENL